MSKLLPYLLGALALIHALPALAVIAPGRLANLYGFAPGDQTLTTLLQHRALLFALLAAALVYAVFVPATRWPVLIGAVASMAGFIAIAAARGELSGALRSIVIADVIGLILAALAAFLLWKGQ
ncbi:MAG: phosphopantetheine adenylyltransferase [Pseudomonadota bacterium]